MSALLKRSFWRPPNPWRQPPASRNRRKNGRNAGALQGPICARVRAPKWCCDILRCRASTDWHLVFDPFFSRFWAMPSVGVQIGTSGFRNGISMQVSSKKTFRPCWRGRHLDRDRIWKSPLFLATPPLFLLKFGSSNCASGLSETSPGGVCGVPRKCGHSVYLAHEKG